MKREEIARTDFASSRRGYAREEVDRHLQAVAAEVARLEEGHRRSASLPGTAADRVRGILEAAEQSASDINAKAEADAQRTAERTDAAIREARAKAEREINEHSKRVEQSLDQALERATSIEAELERTAQALQSSFTTLVADLRGGIESVRAQLDEVRGSLPDAPAAAAERRTQPREQRDRAKEQRDREAKELGAWAGPRSGRSGGAEARTEEQAKAGAQTEEQARADVPTDDRAAESSAGEASPTDQRKPAGGKQGREGARMIALNMALKGTPREETARYLEGNFELDDADAVVDDVYSKVDR